MGKCGPRIWTPEHDAKLCKMVCGNLSHEVMAERLNVTIRAIGMRLWLLGLSNGRASLSRHATEQNQRPERKAQRAIERLALRRQQRGKRKPASSAELKRVIESTSVPVTKLPPGTHAGWTPSWY